MDVAGPAEPQIAQWAREMTCGLKRVLGICPECGPGPCNDDCLPPFTD